MRVPRCTGILGSRWRNYAGSDLCAANSRKGRGASFVRAFVPIVGQSTNPMESVWTIIPCRMNWIRISSLVDIVQQTYRLIRSPEKSSGLVKLILMNPNCISTWRRLSRLRKFAMTSVWAPVFVVLVSKASMYSNCGRIVDSRYPYNDMVMPAFKFDVKLKRFHSIFTSVGSLSKTSSPRKKIRSVAVAGVSV